MLRESETGSEARLSPGSVEQPVPLACAFIALFTGLLIAFAILAVSDWRTSALVRMSPFDQLAGVALDAEPGFWFVPVEAHYDGVYYYAIAIDPLARGEAHELIDLAAHRYGHPAYGWLGWLFSLGRTAWVPEALFVLNIAGMFVAALYLSLLARHVGASPWFGLIAAVNPGMLFAVTADTSEAVSAAVLMAGLWYWVKDRRGVAAALFAALCFFKFQLLLVPAALALWDAVGWARDRRRSLPVKQIASLAIGPVLFGLWQIYVHERLGEWPTSLGPELLTIPPLGVFETMALQGRLASAFNETSQIISGGLPLLTGAFILIVLATLRAVRLRTRFDAIFLLQAAMVLSLNWWNLYYPKELFRVTAIPLLVIPFVFHARDAERPSGVPPTGGP